MKVPAYEGRAVFAAAAMTLYTAVLLVPVPTAEAKRAHGRVDPSSFCAQCDKSKCPVIGPVPVQYCPPHSIVRDACGCCERCTALIVLPSTISKAHACTNVTCPARQMCMANIQGLPICRCPTEQMCRDFIPRQTKVCAVEGGITYVTYPSECHMRVASCHYPSRKIKLMHRGACDESMRLDDFQQIAASKLSKGRDAFGWIEHPQRPLTAEVAATSSARTTAAIATAKVAANMASVTAEALPSSTAVTTTSTRSTPFVTGAPSTARPSITSTTVLPTVASTTAYVVPNEPTISATSGRGRNRPPRVHSQERNRDGRRRDRAAAAAAAAAAAQLTGAGRNAVRHGGASGSRASGDKTRAGKPSGSS